MSDYPFQRHSPLLSAALAALDREAENNPAAARLARELKEVCPLCAKWDALDVLNHFDTDMGIKTRPALMAVLLKELSEAFPVRPQALLS